MGPCKQSDQWEASAPSLGDSFGALQVCISQYGWIYITPSDWTQAAVRLACRQLNLGYMSEKKNNPNPIIIYTLFLQTLHQEV